MFELQPRNIITAITTDENDEEIDYIEREIVFICDRCCDRYVIEGPRDD